MNNQNSQNSAGRKKILVIDDEQNLLHSLSFTLKRNNYLVTTCTDGKKALSLIKAASYNKELFDLIITDIQLPGLNGLDLIDEINKLKIDTPIFVITNYGSGELAVALLRRNCSEYLDKPFTMEKFIGKISEIFSKKGELDHINDASNRQNQPKTENNKKVKQQVTEPGSKGV